MSSKFKENNIKCYWCGQKVKKIYSDFPVKNKDLYMCEHCKIAFQHPLEETSEFYSEAYFNNWGEKEEIIRMKKKDFSGLLKLIEKYNELNEKNLLDIGAAQGILMDVAKEKGWCVEGVEISNNVKFITKEIEQKIHKDDFLKVEFPHNYFTLITMISVLEHIENPTELINKISRILKPSGLLMILVPNMDSLSRKFLGKKWPHFNAPHLFYYNKNFFKRLAKEYGFEFVFSKAPISNYSIFYILNQIRLNSKGLLAKLSGIIIKIIPRFMLKCSIKLNGGNILVILKKK